MSSVNSPPGWASSTAWSPIQACLRRGFVDAGGRLALAAANGGSDHHPDWYLNIESGDQVTIEVAAASIPSVATIASGAERVRLLQLLVDSLPGMADHVSATTREIPVVVFDQAS